MLLFKISFVCLRFLLPGKHQPIVISSLNSKLYDMLGFAI